MPGLTQDEIERLFAPLAAHDRIGLAVSGGPDSLALMLLAAQWTKGEGRPRAFVYTVDHGLRPEAAAEARMVVREAEALGLAARSLRWEGDKPRSGLQAAARAARYRLMAAAMARDGVEVLVTAHHLGDQAETVLMRLAHGSGIEGLRGMDTLSRVEGCTVYRPLLGVLPEVLAGIVGDAGLGAARDPSNADEDFERVRWRLMLPALEALGLTRERLGTLARRMDEAAAMVRAGAELAYPRLVTAASADRYVLSADGFARLDFPVAVMLLGQVLGRVAPDRRGPPLGPLEMLARRLRQTDPVPGVTLHGSRLHSDGQVIVVQREGPRRAGRTRAVQGGEASG